MGRAMARRRSTQPGDVVLIYLVGKPASFARVEDIRPHPRPGWYFCDLLVLGVPPQPLTWILERDQIDGTEFTMGGQPVRLEALGELGAVHAQQRAAVDAEAGGGSAEKEPGPAPAKDEAAGDGEGKPKPRAGNVVKLFPRGT
jgi:hypothetical protein